MNESDSFLEANPIFILHQYLDEYIWINRRLLSRGGNIQMYDNYFQSNETPTYRQRITMQQAMDIALQSVPGNVVHVDMDLENGVLVYEVFVLTSDNRIFEVEIVAKTGRILKIEQENDLD